ncbi:hypothetical protein GCM10011491_06440 [Brucella endophytica]|uniref:Uncharacterized protein n=1 Tax=Brucella endophytica TaxID=1963359 RepID=A0A916S2Y4_9HYPH|nr:hypothetical protein GCM10011491_06440 [Brucella endophytica]
MDTLAVAVEGFSRQARLFLLKRGNLDSAHLKEPPEILFMFPATPGTQNRCSLMNIDSRHDQSTRGGNYLREDHLFGFVLENCYDSR